MMSCVQCIKVQVTFALKSILLKAKMQIFLCMKHLERMVTLSNCWRLLVQEIDPMQFQETQVEFQWKSSMLNMAPEMQIHVSPIHEEIEQHWHKLNSYINIESSLWRLNIVTVMKDWWRIYMFIRIRYKQNNNIIIFLWKPRKRRREDEMSSG